MAHSASEEEDLAKPLYQSKSTPPEQGLSHSDVSAVDEQTSVIPRLAEDGSHPPDITVSSLGSNVEKSDEVPNAVYTQAAEDIADHQTHNATTLSVDEDGDDNRQLGPEASTEAKDNLCRELRDVFALPADEKLQSFYPVWLLKSVMLQGQLYVMESVLCFYAYIPLCEDVSIKSGFLVKKSRTSARYHRHWFILKNDVLSYYNDVSDLYFPNGNIDLRRAKSVVVDVDSSLEGAFGFKVVTDRQEYKFRADTASAVNEWTKLIQKVIFRLKNEGNSVKIVLPYEKILDVEESKVIDFATTIKIRIADDHETFALNEYYFSVTANAQKILTTIKDKIVPKSTDQGPQDRWSRSILDTSKSAPSYHRPEVYESLGEAKRIHDEGKPNIETFAHQIVHEHKSSVPFSLPNLLPKIGHDRSTSTSQDLSPIDHDDLRAQAVERNREHREIQSKNPKSLGNRLKNVGHIATNLLQAPTHLFSGKDTTETAPGAEDLANAQRFQDQFGLPDQERLLRTYQPFYTHGVPLLGDLYVSDAHICFRNSTPGAKIRIMLPLSDIESATEQNGFRFGFSGMSIDIRAHEAVFFEFRLTKERDQCLAFINGALNNHKITEKQKQSGQEEARRQAEHDHDEHARLEAARTAAGAVRDSMTAPLENVIDVPPIIFDSPNASLLAFKPPTPMRFTCLTIGSRGDVQPYVALCKGLIADGQKAKIATHEEFRDFVESHGIEFVPIDGNPAELMAICVEHGMFTYGFLKEASSKFRGWIDELLASSWKACQNTDILIESPSAMGGIHIAEALGIPYYRAFTMPWSKTRVYPHAFAVPDHNMGGNYNALTYSAFDTLFWKAISGQVNRWRKKSLNLPSTNFDKLAQHKVPFLYNFSPSVVPPAIDWHEWIRVTGYWFLDESDDKKDKKWEPPEKVTKFIQKARTEHKRLIYVGFGSIVVSDPKALTRAVVTAVKESGVRCILVKGWSARSSKSEDSNSQGSDDDEGADDETFVDDSEKDKEDTKRNRTDAKDEPDYGDEILSLDSIPHDWLFPQMDAVCHHGGAGSLGASLRAGKPTIVKPFFGDQYFFGSRVQELGVGICLKKLTVKSLKGAIKHCTTDTLTIQKAEKIGEHIRGERGVDIAIENIYRDLEYAKSLVKHPTRSGSSDSSNESWDEINKDEATSDVDDEDLFDNHVHPDGTKSSILKPFKSLHLPNPLGEGSSNYGLSGIKLFKNRAETFKLRSKFGTS